MLNAVRGILIVVAGLFGYALAAAGGRHDLLEYISATLAGVLIGLLLVIIEVAISKKFIAMFGLVIIATIFGFVVSHFLISALYLIPAIKSSIAPQSESPGAQTLRLIFEFGVTSMITLVSLIAVIHMKDDLRVSLPWITFGDQKKSGNPIILDTSAIIDGRILELIDTNLIDSQLVVPQFVLNELHKLSDSEDKQKRIRGKRGLDVLQKLKENKNIDLNLHKAFLPYLKEVDEKLVRLAKLMNGRIMTCDANLAKIAQVQGIDTISLHEVTRALQLPIQQGDRLEIELVRPGENPGQGVGFLEDGTMVVGEGCRERIGQKVRLVITNIITTQAGRMIFGRPE